MKTIVLGKSPKNFKSFVVKFTLPDGEEGKISATFKYRSRKDFGAMMNQMFSDAGEEKSEGVPDFQELFGKMGDKNADHLLNSLDSWNLDFELNRDNLCQLSDQYPAAAVALMAAYRNACVDGALGN